MQAMVLVKPKNPLILMDLPIPQPLTGQVLIRIEACGIVAQTCIFMRANYHTLNFLLCSATKL